MSQPLLKSLHGKGIHAIIIRYAKFFIVLVLVPVPRLATWRSILDEPLDENWVQTRALPEDVSLLGFTPLTEIHSRLDRKWSRLTRDCQYLEVGTSLLSNGSFFSIVRLRNELFCCFRPQFEFSV